MLITAATNKAIRSVLPTMEDRFLSFSFSTVPEKIVSSGAAFLSCIIVMNCCTEAGRLSFIGCMAVLIALSIQGDMVEGNCGSPCCDMSIALGGVCPETIFSRVAPRA